MKCGYCNEIVSKCEKCGNKFFIDNLIYCDQDNSIHHHFDTFLCYREFDETKDPETDIVISDDKMI